MGSCLLGTVVVELTKEEQTMKVQIPPIGIIPYMLWVEIYLDPTLEQLLKRYREVSTAVDRYLAAGIPPMKEWYRELGTKQKERSNEAR